MESSRDRHIDIAKGIAIICIILGHLGVRRINQFVFTFHVPIFFLIIGYFLSTKLSVRDFARRRFRTLIVPYILACLAIIILSLLKNQLLNGGMDDRGVLKHWVYASLYGAGDSYKEPFPIPGIGAIWFLLATFWASILLRWLLDQGLIFRIGFIAVWFAACCLSRRLFWFPLSIQASGPALLYMYIGHSLKEMKPLAADIGRVLAWLGFYSLFVLCMHIIELDVMPWGGLIQRLIPEPTELQLIAGKIMGKLIWSVGLTAVCMRIPFFRKLFGY